MQNEKYQKRRKRKNVLPPRNLYSRERLKGNTCTWLPGFNPGVGGQLSKPKNGALSGGQCSSKGTGIQMFQKDRVRIQNFS